jgi:hypothetical protein
MNTYRIGRTCRNCSERREENGKLWCVYDQSIIGWCLTRNPRARACKCPFFQNEKLIKGIWKSDDVFFKYPDKIYKKYRQ